MGIEKDFDEAWNNFYNAFNEGRTGLVSKLEKLNELVIIGKETLKSLEELRANLNRYQTGFFGKHITHRGYAKAMTEWVNYVNKCISDLNTQIRLATEEVERKEGLTKLAEEWWNGCEGIKKELEDSAKLLNEILSHSTFGKYGVMTPKLRRYLNSLWNSQTKFLNQCENFIGTARNPDFFKTNFRDVYTKLNLTDLLRAQREFLDLVHSFDAIIGSERRKTIPKLEKLYEEEFGAMYSDVSKLSEIYKRNVQFIKTVNLEALLSKTAKFIEEKK
ncbi:MAG: hypothetical protein QMD36_01055 [Candidatus Aenigmarchaeota archaeon]|nr:hypothetical protein [Candidatus Aenigmarchaeota archaeon]